MNRLFTAIAEDEVLSERWAELGITRRKMFQYLWLFCVLLVIYSICLSGYVKFLMKAPEGLGLGDLMRPLVKFCFISALPFGVLAYSEKSWRSRDAAQVIVAAWAAVYAGLSMQYHDLCPMGAAIPLVPFILSAQLAHTVGTLCQSGKRAEPSRL